MPAIDSRYIMDSRDADRPNQELLTEFASPESQKIYVGKRGGRPSIKQPEINQILVEACQKVSLLLLLAAPMTG